MNRDPAIQKAFEVADDSLQGVLGYHLYTIAAQRASDRKRVGEYLPDDRIPITFAWDRFYNKQELVDLFSSNFFELIQARISLIYATSVFDDVLSKFIQHLDEKGSHQKCRSFYRERILWAYKECLRCPLSAVGNEETLARLPTTFGIIDNARRLRNLILHNHGLFDMRYETDAINSNGIKVDLHPHYKEYKKDPQKPFPIIITTNDLLQFIQAYIEVLHVLHNSIQEKFFGVTEGYSYQKENKPIDWKRLLFGSSKVEIKFQRS